MKNVFSFLLAFYIGNVSAQQLVPIAIPDTLSGTNISLIMHTDSVHRFDSGPYSHTYAFNQYSYLGPTLILEKGKKVQINVQNEIGDTTSIHWHGLHVPAKQDGGPHTPIMPNSIWHPEFTIMNHASTFWYHPHTHMKTTIQAMKGAAGFIIVRDAAEAVLNLPRTYGVDDFPIAVQCQQYDKYNQIMPLGMQDSTLLVNGVRANKGYIAYLNIPAQVIRLRLLNASGERSFQFGFSNNFPFYIIGSDGGLLPRPINSTRVRLSPGERAEILLNVSGMSGQTIALMSYASELPMGVQGGPTMPMPSGPPMDSPLNGIDFSIAQLHIQNQTTNAIKQVPSNLVSMEYLDPTFIQATRVIRFNADSDTVMDGPFYFNGKSFNMERIDYTIPLGQMERWKIVNNTMVAHPFHTHDVQFQLQSRNGEKPAECEQGWKDVVLIPSGDSIEFITQFNDFADDSVPYMYHCHILMHEDAGMMGQFIVTKKNSSIKPFVTNKPFSTYPNPFQDELIIQFEKNKLPENVQLTLFDTFGKNLFAYNLNTNSEFKIDARNLPEGLYILEVKTPTKTWKEKYIHTLSY